MCSENLQYPNAVIYRNICQRNRNTSTSYLHLKLKYSQTNYALFYYVVLASFHSHASYLSCNSD